jgi:hypothetical protein
MRSFPEMNSDDKTAENKSNSKKSGRNEAHIMH